MLIHLCYTGISSFAGDLINSVICLEEASNSTCVTSVAGLCLRIRVAHNQGALCIFGALQQWGITPRIPISLQNNSNLKTTRNVFCDKQHLRARHALYHDRNFPLLRNIPETSFPIPFLKVFHVYCLPDIISNRNHLSHREVK